MTHLFPIYLDMREKNCLVIGGGQVAQRKVENFMDYDVNITVVSPRVENDIKHWAEQGIVKWFAREFKPADLDGMFMVFVATDNMDINAEIVRECRERAILVNAVDDPPHCDFFVPSIVRRSSLVVAISTEGKSPLFARRLREEMEELITPEYGEFVDIMGEIREQIKSTVPDISERKKVFEALVYSDILDLFKAGEKEKVRERIEECMSSWRD